MEVNNDDKLAIFILGVFVNSSLNSYTGKWVLSVNIYITNAINMVMISL